MTHIAMFDAINAIEREFEPYRVRLRHRGRGSPEAAAAQAAHDVLVAINPAATAAYDALLARQLGKHPSGFVRRGAAVGARVAEEILAWRQNDGWIVSRVPALFRAAAAGTLAADAAEQRRRDVHASSERRADGAADARRSTCRRRRRSLTSERYATDLNEVKLIGKSDSATRTAEQTAIARLWAGIATTGTGTATNFLAIWNNIARDVARERRLSLVEAARCSCS